MQKEKVWDSQREERNKACVACKITSEDVHSKNKSVRDFQSKFKAIHLLNGGKNTTSSMGSLEHTHYMTEYKKGTNCICVIKVLSTLQILLYMRRPISITNDNHEIERKHNSNHAVMLFH